MISLITPPKAQKKLVENLRERRLTMGLTQEVLAERSGVALPTLRKFEQKGSISLASFLNILRVLGGLEEIIEITRPAKPSFSSIEEVLNTKEDPTPKRGRRK